MNRGLINFGTIATGYSMNYFLPTILNDLGWQAADAQVHTIPVYLVAFVFLLLSAYLSDLTRHRFAFVVAPVIISTAGWAILLAQRRNNVSEGVLYAATFLAMFSGWQTPLLMTWLMNNLGGHWKRACGAAVANMVGSCAGLVASNVFLGE
jgi:MFS family permease